MTIDLKALVRSIPDYPKAGIIFRDITSLIEDSTGFRESVERLADAHRGKGITKVAGIEARGFIFGAGVAIALGVGFVPVRKAGKLPAATRSRDYELEYGSETLEIHEDAVAPGDRVVVVDDVLATGGTARAACELVEGLGAELVGLGFLIELEFLHGAARLDGRRYVSLLRY
jgi:adenine phosphoribosyltransferase